MKTKHLTLSFFSSQWRARAPRRLRSSVAAFGLLFGAAVPLHAQYTYTNGVNPNGGSGVNNWGTATSWYPNVVANGVDVAASFNIISNGVAYEPNLTINGSYTVGSMWSTNNSGWILKYTSGAGVLTLQTTPPAQPLLYLGSSSSECWWQGGYMAGTQGFVLNSATANQKFTFRYDGNFMTNFSGPIIVGNGQLGFNGAGNFGYANSLTLSNGTQLVYESANTVASPNATFASMPIVLAGGAVTIANNGIGALVIQGPVQSTGTNTNLTVSSGSSDIILSGTNAYPGNTTISAGALLSSTTSTGAGSHTVAASATDGALVTAPGTSLILSNLTLTATTAANSSALAFCPGAAGVPTVPMINVTNLLTLGNTNFTTPIKLFGGGWQVGSSIPLLHFGAVTNVFTNGLFKGFQLAALPAGIGAALVDGTATNQINLNVTAITPLVWAPAAANANWATNGNWTLNGTATNYTEAYAGFGPSVLFDDSLTPAGPSIIVTNSVFVSPNSIVFNNTNKNYTLVSTVAPTGQGAGFQNNTSLTMNGPGYVTNSLFNVYLGGTFLNAGTMVLNGPYALPANAGLISFGGGTLQFSANNTIDLSSQFSTAANQRFSLNTGGKNIPLASGLTSSGGSLTVAGGGTVTLGGASTYTGGTTNLASTFKLGVANAIPTSSGLTLGSSGNTASLDLAGFGQQLSGLNMDPNSSSPVVITNSSMVNPVTLTFNGGSSSFAGSIVDGAANGGQSLALTVAGGSLTLTAPNTYTNTTTITNGAKLFISGSGSITSTNVLVASGSLFDVSGINYVSQPGGNLGGIGNVNGNVTIATFSAVQPDVFGASGNHGTLTFSNALTLNQGAVCNLNVATTAASANNDRLLVLGQLSANDPNGNTLQIQGPAGLNLDTGTDYTLISSPNSTISGTFNVAPFWVGTPPANYAHYSVVTSPNAVTLHYSVNAILSGQGSVSPQSGLHQTFLFTVNVTPGTGSTGIGVTVDFSQLGGLSGTPLTGSGNTFSINYTVPGTAAIPGTYSVPFTVTDAQNDTYSGDITVIIRNGTLVWDGASPLNNNWDSTNWLNGATPDLNSGDAGDALLFAGGNRLYPAMDNPYSATAVTFSNNAGLFNITNSTGASLTLAANGTVENDSANAEYLDLPINLTSGAKFNTPAGNLIVGPLSGSSDGFTKNGSGKLIIDGTNGQCNYSGATTISGGTLAISNADNVLPTGTTVAYTAPATLNLGGQNQSVANLNLSSLSTGTATATNGNLTVTGATLNLSPNTTAAAATTVDLSGLSTLTFPSGNIYFYGAIGGNSTVKLAQTNYISASAIYVANGGLTAVAPNYTATILLGQSNFLNAGTIQLGGYHNASGAVAFNTGLNNPSLILRGVSGAGSPVGTMNIGVNNNGSNPSFSFNTSAGSIDAMVNNLYILNNNSGGGSWVDSLSMSNGTFNVGDVFMNYDNGTTTSGSSAVVNQNGGTMLVGTLGLNANASTGSTNGLLPTTTSIFNLGNGTNGFALLSATSITIGATVAPSTNSTATLNFTNGTIENYDPALGQSDSVGAVQGGSSVQQNLEISGLAGGGAPGNSLTLNIVLAATGTHKFFAESGYSITEDATALISGNGGLTANGPGLVTLNGTNTYTGNTTVSAGTLELAQPTLFWRSSVSVSNGALLQLDFAATNLVAALIINGTNRAPGVYSAATDPAYLTNAGSLLVVPLKTNAYLSSLALNPADSLTPNFATNLFVYYATNAFGIKPTLTVTDGDLTASNELILNGLAFQVLTSGVPSRVLSFGVGSTNVLKVLVTAQDGVTTNLYAVNLTQVAPKTNAFLLSLALNPADSLTPGFLTNTFVYYATNAYGIIPTLTVTNGDLTASNELILNGLNFQVLTSGVPSLLLSNLGPGSTNVLKVLVTAQDGVTTNLYAVNLTQVPVGTNAYLTSLALNPADSLTPNFAFNGFAYYATNAYGITPTLTVTNANLTASNVLILNGLTFQVLTSGVPSLLLTNLGVGSTNVLKVLVTAQNGVTTNLYTINLTELAPVNTNTFAITNLVNGNNLNLSWPADHKGWRLQVQTNSAGAGLSTNWYDWPNSTNLTSVSIPLNPANSSVFLRMLYP